MVINFGCDDPLAYARNVAELEAIINYLNERQFIDRANYTDVVLRAEGLEEIESRRASNLTSEKAFVAMSFAKGLTSVYTDCIKPGIESAGYRSIQLSFEEYNDDVVAQILAEIREARFVVADFTEHRQNVYFEAGFALGLSLPVIWLCRKDDVEQLHFDTEHFKHICREHEDPFAHRLNARIRATIGKGPIVSSGVG